MPRAFNANSHATLPSLLEDLEQRLLLTTVHGGEMFLYHNSQNDAIVVVVNGDSNDSVELISSYLTDPTDPSTMVIDDLPGVRYDAIGTPTIVPWDGGTLPVDPITNNWVAPTLGGPRGGYAEIYAMYIPQASLGLQIIVMPVQNAATASYANAQQWDPMGGAVPDVLPDDNAALLSTPAPANSGAALVGAIQAPLGQTTVGDQFHYAGVGLADPVNFIGGIGDFPGGDLRPGITVVSGDVDTVVVSGTMAGQLSAGGDVDTIQAGFLWGNIISQGNLGDVVLDSGGGLLGIVPNESIIRAEGSIRSVDARNGIIAATILANNDAAVEAPSNTIYELEDSLTPYYPAAFTNDDNDTAQWISHPSGIFTVLGNTFDLAGQDVFALPLMAGQTVTINGGIITGAGASTFLSTDGSSTQVYLYDSAGRLMDTLGFATIQSAGLDPRTTQQKPLNFTAPAADVYYVYVTSNALGGDEYYLEVDGPGASLGGVTALSGYTSDFNDMTGTSGINVNQGGNLGGTHILGGAFFATIYVRGGGNLMTFQADFATSMDIQCDGNIGLIQTTDPLVGDLGARIVAGSALYNTNAFIQNINVGRHLIKGQLWTGEPYGIFATGSIGVIEVGGNFQGIDLTVNTDQDPSDPGRVDLIVVMGNWGDFEPGVGFTGAPVLRHGPGGNFGYIDIHGTVWKEELPGIGVTVLPTVYNDGQTHVLDDDGGGHLRVTGGLSELTNATGDPILDPLTGLPMFVPTTISFIQIPVDDSTGGVIANLTSDGSVTMVNDGVVHVTNLDLANAWDADIRVTGSGAANFYYITTAIAPPTLYTRLHTLINDTDGSIVSGDMGSVTTISTGGSVGPDGGSTGEWLHGRDDYDFLTNPRLHHTKLIAVPQTLVEPEFGWFRGKINGLNINGDVGTLRVGGSLGDLRIVYDVAHANTVLGGIDTIIVNSDHATAPGHWDGVVGLIFAEDHIGTIRVGDGLADTGGSDVARAGIMSTGHIGNVLVDGPRYTIDGRVFHELEGAIIAYGSNVPFDVLDVNGNIVRTVQDSIENVIGTGGAWNSAMIRASTLNLFSVIPAGGFITGGIGKVSFGGDGAIISDSFISGLWVREVSTSVDSLGLTNSTILAVNPSYNLDAIGKVSAGGSGIQNVLIRTIAGSVGSVSAIGPNGDIIGCQLDVADEVGSVSAQNIRGNQFNIINTLGSLTAVRDIGDNTPDSEHPTVGFHMGGLGRMNVGRNFFNNFVTVAGTVGSAVINGDFDNSRLILQGPESALLKSMTVKGDMSGELLSAGPIRKLVVNGEITADVSTVTLGSSGDIGLLQADGGFTGSLEVAGTLVQFKTMTSLGTNPGALGASQVFNIWGDLGKVRVQAPKGSTSDLFANFNVGGNIGTIDIDGTLFGIVSTVGNLKSVILDGALGGQIGGVDHGALVVSGELGSLRFNASEDLVADLTVGGTIKAIAMKGGSITGDVTSMRGAITAVTLTGGSLTGNLAGESIGKITATNASLLGNMTATDGGIGSITVRNGNIDANISAANGDIGLISVTGGGIAAGHSIFASGDIMKIQITGGDLGASVTAGGRIGSISVKGSDILANVDAEGGIGSIAIDGDLSATVRSGTTIGSIAVGSMTGAIVSSASDIGTLTVAGAMVNSFVLAGYDVGHDGDFDGGDDNLANGGNVHSGSLASGKIGTMNASVLAAGIDPGVDEDFLDTGDNVSAAGVSRIKKLTVTAFVNPDQSAVVADTSIDPAFLAVVDPLVVTDAEGGADLVGAGTDFGASVGSPTLVAGTITLTLTGAGTANFDPATGILLLNGTGANSKLTLQGSFATAITITGSEDSGLGSLTVTGSITLGDINIDGEVGTMNLGQVADTSTLSLPGGVKTLNMSVTDADIDLIAGNVGKMGVAGHLDGGTLQFDTLGTLAVSGGMDGDIDILMGGAGTIGVGGAMGGSTRTKGAVGTFNVGAAMSGDLAMTQGDLGTLRTGGSLTGAVDVQLGRINNLTVSSGNLGGMANSSLRANDGIGRMTVGGNLSGLVSTDGNIDNLAITGNFTGRVRAGQVIKSVTAGAMTNGLLTAGSDITTVRIARDMLGSEILAGFDPGDAGFAGNGDTEVGNVQLDGVTAPTVPLNVDVAGSGNIKLVTVGGNMTTSAIGAGVSPGADGFICSYDDVANGTGIVYRVTVKGYIVGSGNAAQNFGIEAASAVPTVTSYGQLFLGQGNVHVWKLGGMAGTLQVVYVNQKFNGVQVTFNHPLNFNAFDSSTVGFVASVDSSFATLGDNTDVLATTAYTLSYDAGTYTLSIATAQPLLNLGIGRYFQVTIDDSVTDTRGNTLDGEYTGTLPSGNGTPGGDFAYVFYVGDYPDTFPTAADISLISDGGPMTISSKLDTGGDVDVFHFSGTAYDFLSASLSVDSDVYDEMALFVLDDQGTVSTADDVYELVTRVEMPNLPGDDLFAAYELPVTGEYYMAVTWLGASNADYHLTMNMTSTDTLLVSALGGSLPSGKTIGYVSNTIGEHRNFEGADSPKQLVYLDFDGGTATKYYDEYGVNVDVAAFDLVDINTSLDGNENVLINGNGSVTGIVDNVMSIYQDTPASSPYGSLTVQRVDLSNPADLAAYQAATEGLFFTTVDPAAAGLDPETDYTTVFVGRANDWIFGGGGGLLGIASTVDQANMSKADNAIVFAQNFSYYNSFSTAVTTDGKLTEFSYAFANTIAHELGHTLGLWHQPTDWTNFMLVADDPDNNPGTADDSNVGPALMAYADAATDIAGLMELGTAPIDHFPQYPDNPAGAADHVDHVLWWLH